MQRQLLARSFNFSAEKTYQCFLNKKIMIAVIKIGGHQSIVSVGDVLDADKISAEVGETVNFQTLLTAEDDGSDTKIGAPLLDIQVSAKIIEHGRGDKIRVYKMKPRKRYRKLQGHRQDYTRIEITAIGGATAKKAAPAKKVVEKKEEVKKPVAKKPATKKAVAKKPAAKKATVKK